MGAVSDFRHCQIYTSVFLSCDVLCCDTPSIKLQDYSMTKPPPGYQCSFRLGISCDELYQPEQDYRVLNNAHINYFLIAKKLCGNHATLCSHRTSLHTLSSILTFAVIKYLFSFSIPIKFLPCYHLPLLNTNAENRECFCLGVLRNLKKRFNVYTYVQ